MKLFVRDGGGTIQGARGTTLPTLRPKGSAAACEQVPVTVGVGLMVGDKVVSPVGVGITVAVDVSVRSSIGVRGVPQRVQQRSMDSATLTGS